MNSTFDKDDSGESGSEDMTRKKLEYEEDESGESDAAGDPASLPTESASLGDKKKKKATAVKKTATAKSSARKNPPFIEMIVEAIIDIGDRKGASIPAIKARMRENYEVTDAAIKKNLKNAISKCEENGTLIRPNASKDNKGLTGRFKVNPEHLKEKARSEKLKEKLKKKSEMKNKPQKRKAPATAVNRKNLKSLQEKSLAVKLAKEKIKQARKSIGLTPNAKPKAAPKKRVKAATKKAAPSKSPKLATKGKPKPKTAKATKGGDKGSAGKKKAAAATAKKKTTKAK